MMNWIKKCLITLLNEDGGKYPSVQVNYNGITKPTYMWMPYGLSTAPPVDALAVVLSGSGRGDDPIAMCADPIGRFKNLKEGEVMVGNHLTRSSTRYVTNGDIEHTAKRNYEITAKDDIEITSTAGDMTISIDAGGFTITTSANIDITAPTVNVTGNLVVTGTVTATVDVIAGPLSISSITHRHNSSAPGNPSGTPIP